VLRDLENLTDSYRDAKSDHKRALVELQADLEAEKNARRGFQETAAALSMVKKSMVNSPKKPI
jgi:hypothetical protein